MKLRLTDFDSNTYMDTDGSCELCMYTGMLDHPLWGDKFSTQQLASILTELGGDFDIIQD